jgi:HAMP domain-containing protein
MSSVAQLGYRYNLAAHTTEIQQVRNEIAAEEFADAPPAPTAEEIAADQALVEQLRAERRAHAERMVERGLTPHTSITQSRRRARR